MRAKTLKSVRKQNYRQPLPIPPMAPPQPISFNLGPIPAQLGPLSTSICWSKPRPKAMAHSFSFFLFLSPAHLLLSISPLACLAFPSYTHIHSPTCMLSYPPFSSLCFLHIPTPSPCQQAYTHTNCTCCSSLLLLSNPPKPAAHPCHLSYKCLQQTKGKRVGLS